MANTVGVNAGTAGLDQVAPDQIRGSEVVVAGDGDQRSFQAPDHVLIKRVLPQPVGPVSSTGSFWR